MSYLDEERMVADDAQTDDVWAQYRARQHMRFYGSLAGGAAALMLGLVVWAGDWSSHHPETWTERPHRFVETDVRLAAAELQAMGPRQVDRETILNRVTSDRREVIHHLWVNADLGQGDWDKLLAEQQTKLRIETCEDPRMRMIVERGGQFSWRYTSRLGQRFTVSVNACPAE